MKDNSSSSWFIALISVIVGILLIIYHGNNALVNRVVQTLGVLVALIGATLTAYQLMLKRDQRNVWTAVLGVIVCAVGLWLVCDSGFFIRFVVYVLAAVLILAGLWHIWSIRAVGRNVNVPIWLWIIPSILIVAGLAIIFTGLRVALSAIVLIVGICLILSAFNTLFTRVERRNRSDEHPTTTDPQ